MRPKVVAVCPTDNVEGTDHLWFELFKIMCNTDLSDYTNSPHITCKEFSDSVYNVYKHFWKTGKYNDADWWLFESLDKLVKENHEF